MNHISRLISLPAALAIWLTLPTAAPAQNTDATNTSAIAPTAGETNAPSQVPQESIQPHRSYEQIVLFGQDAELKAGESARDVVVIGGNATIHGKVQNAVTVIGGTLEVDGEVGEAAVAVLGNVKIKSGAVIHRDTVSVLGSLVIEPGAVVHHDAVCVGGRSHIDTNAKVYGNIVNPALPFSLPDFKWLRDYVKYCLFELRPFAPRLGWMWGVAGFIFLFYLFIAVVCARPVQICAETVGRRPATTFLVGLCFKLLVPLVIFILSATVVGLLVVPFLLAAILIGGVIGKVALLEWIGFGFKNRDMGTTQRSLLALAIGFGLVLVLYMIPILGFLVYALFGIWGLGCATMAIWSARRREISQKPASNHPGSSQPPGPSSTPLATGVGSDFTRQPMTGSSAISGTAELHTEGAGIQAGVVVVPEPGPTAPPLFDVPLPASKAGFWTRMGAACLDLILVVFVGVVLGGPAQAFILGLAYFVGLWVWKGTTVGGIILRLKVVRIDGSPVSFVVALVRGLAGAFSAVVLFLGFFWIAWDPEKQGWHDKIAGTDVIRLDKSMPLV